MRNLPETCDKLAMRSCRFRNELVFAHKAVTLTIVFLRYQEPELTLMRQLLLQVVSEYINKKGNFFVTIARGKIRVTEL